MTNRRSVPRDSGTRRRLENVIGIAFLTLLVLYRFREGALLRVVYSLGDNGSDFLPIRMAAAQAFRRLDFLLWSPEIQGGYPSYADPHTAVFYPFNWILSFVMPGWAAFNYFALLHFVIIAGSMFAFLRPRGLSLLPCLLGAVVFALNGNRIYDSYLFLGPIAYFPLVLLLVEKGLFERDPHSLALAALLNGIEGLAGSPPTAFVLNVGVLTYVLVRLLLSRERPDLVRLGVSFALFYALSFGLTAVQALPTREFAQMTTRASPTWDFITQGSLRPSDLTKLVSGHFIEYIGGLPIVLAFVGSLASRQRSSARAFALFTVIAVVFCLGKYTPFYRVLFAYVPGFSKFRIPMRFHVLLSFGVAVLAALGMQTFLDWTERFRRGAVLGLLASALLFVAVVWDYWRIDRYQYDPANSTPAGVFRSPVEVARYIERQPTKYRTLPVMTRIDIWSPYAAKRQILEGNSPLLTRVESSAGYVPLHYVPYMNLLNHLDLVQGVARQRLASFLTIGHLVTDADYPPGYPAGLVPRARTHGGVRLFENPTALSRVIISDDLFAVPDQERALDLLLNGAWDPRTRLLVPTGQLVPGRCETPLAASIQRISYEATRVRIDATTNCGAVLCLLDTFYPGWKVTVNGGRAELFPANLIYRGVRLGPGENHVEFRYRPRSLALVTVISLATLAVLLVALVKLPRRPATATESSRP